MTQRNQIVLEYNFALLYLWQIYNGVDDTYNQLAKICHQKKKSLISTSGNFMFVRFVSDYSYQGSGFTANFSAVETSKWNASSNCCLSLVGIVTLHIRIKGYFYKSVKWYSICLCHSNVLWTLCMNAKQKSGLLNQRPPNIWKDLDWTVKKELHI